MTLSELIYASQEKGEASFRSFVMQDTNVLGGTSKKRRINDPNQQMRKVHEQLIRCLRKLPIDLNSATGAVKGHNPITNISPHRKNRYFLLLDIKNAYQTVKKSELVRILVEADPSILQRGLFNDCPALEQFLDNYCLDKMGGLLTGAPASPDLYNIYAAALLDQKLRALCEKYGLTYTRYIDDITLSSTVWIGKKKRQAIHRLIRESGLVIHERKTQLHDLQKSTIKITGFVLNYGGRITLPRQYLNKLRGFIHLAIKERQLDQKTRRKLNGMAAQLYASVQAPNAAPRKKSWRRRSRPMNKTEQRVAKLHREYLSLCSQQD